MYGVQMPQREGALLGECLAHSKAQDFVELGKRVNCAKVGGPVLRIYASYDVLLHKVTFSGRDVTAPHLGSKIPKNLHLRREKSFSSHTR